MVQEEGLETWEEKGEDMEAKRTLKVGDPCFAKVKGWMPYPARIVGVQRRSKKLKFTVIFYKTKETGEIWSENLWSVTPVTVKKMVTEKSLKKDIFKNAFEEMKRHHKLDEFGMPLVEGVEHEIDDTSYGDRGEPSEKEDEFDVEFDNIFRNKRNFQANSAVTEEDVEEVDNEIHSELECTDVVGEAVAQDVENTDSADLGEPIIGAKESMDIIKVDKGCVEGSIDDGDTAESTEDKMEGNQKNKIVRNKKKQKPKATKANRKVRMIKKKGAEETPVVGAEKTPAAGDEDTPAAGDEETPVAGDEETPAAGEEETPATGEEDAPAAAAEDAGETRPRQVSQTADKARVTKPKVVKPKRSQTLRESELVADEAFADKIVITDENTYLCKHCPLFVTSVKLVARSHAQACGVKKKLGRRSKKIKCDECGEEFKGKKNLMKHILKNHSLPSYQCSVCRKRFKSRVNYKKHLMIHNHLKSVNCPHCPKTFSFESYKKRHIKRVHEKNLKIPQNVKDKNGEKEIAVIINQDEEFHGGNFFWKFGASFPNTEKFRSCSYQQFFSSLGLNSKEEWEDWLLVSKMLNLSIKADGSNDGFEVAVTKQGNGDETVVCAGSQILIAGKIFTMEDFVKEIVCELAGTAVDLACGSVDQPNEVLSLDEDVGKYGVAGKVECDGSIEKLLRDLHFQEKCPTVTAELSNVIVEPATDDDPYDVNDGVGDPTVASTKTSSRDDENVARLIVCHHCEASGFKDGWFLRRHISQMHVGSVQCDICDNVFIDKHRYLQHSRTCYYWCDKDGCNYHEKRKSRVDSHKRRHERDS